MTTRPKFDPVARIAAAGLALLAAASVLLQLYLSTGELGGLGAALWMLGRFFTVLTNTLVAITFGLLAMRYRVSSRWLLALTAAIAGVGRHDEILAVPAIKRDQNLGHNRRIARAEIHRQIGAAHRYLVD